MMFARLVLIVSVLSLVEVNHGQTFKLIDTTEIKEVVNEFGVISTSVSQGKFDLELAKNVINVASRMYKLVNGSNDDLTLDDLKTLRENFKDVKNAEDVKDAFSKPSTLVVMKKMAKTAIKLAIKMG